MKTLLSLTLLFSTVLLSQPVLAQNGTFTGSSAGFVNADLMVGTGGTPGPGEFNWGLHGVRYFSGFDYLPPAIVPGDVATLPDEVIAGVAYNAGSQWLAAPPMFGFDRGYHDFSVGTLGNRAVAGIAYGNGPAVVTQSAVVGGSCATGTVVAQPTINTGGWVHGPLCRSRFLNAPFVGAEHAKIGAVKQNPYPLAPLMPKF